MSESGEKAFEPTPSRIEKARREGNAPRAGELGANVAFLASVACAVAMAPWFGRIASAAIAAGARGQSLDARLWMLPAVASVPAAGACLAGVVAGLLQSKGLRWSALSVKLERLSPVEGAKRMLSRESMSHGLRAIAAFALSALLLAPGLTAVLSAAGNVNGAAAAAWLGAQRVCLSAGLVGLAFSLLEFSQARRAWLRRLRMSFADLKRENKEQEGDPVARGRRRSRYRELARGSIQNIKRAAFVLVNPTHVAIALEYRPPVVPVPCVLVRAAGEAALRAREVAVECGVPVIENAPLARALYEEARIGDAIPHAHYVAVAEVVWFLMRSGDLPGA